jgi:hypothetical protein
MTFIFEKWWKCCFKNIMKSTIKLVKWLLVAILKVTDENSRIRIQMLESEVRIRGSGSGSGPKCHGPSTLIFGGPDLVMAKFQSKSTGNVTLPKVGEQVECVILAGRLTVPSASVRLLAAIRSTSVGLLAAARTQNWAAASQDGAAAAQEGRRGGGISRFDGGKEEIVGELGGGGRHTQVHQVGRLLSALRPVIGRWDKLFEPIGTARNNIFSRKGKKQKTMRFYFSTF